ncbi:MAG: sigma-54 interaction domain-containing protein [Opitutales bacterium]
MDFYAEGSKMESNFGSLLGELILNSAGDGIFGLDANGRTTFANPAACEMIGYSQEEMLGVSSHDLIHHSHPDGSSYLAKTCPIYAAFSDGKVHSVGEDVFWRKDGTSLNVEYTSTPIWKSGNLIGAVVVFRNLTPLKESEENLRKALREVQKLKDRLAAENTYLQEEIKLQNNFENIVGQSAAIGNALIRVETVAPTSASVLITGETGTGKELLARAIHHLSDRSSGPFIKVNCPAIPKDLFESEFFGHVKGAFTGATSDRAGRFELADKGTLFLDEVGELPPSMQSKLLRVLQEREFERVGESRSIKVDTRIVAATNRNLKKEMREGGFREDLYYRINVFPIQVAPLRDRREDVEGLATKFLLAAKKRFNRPSPRLTKANLEQLQRYDWPGNVRELQNVIERATMTATGKALRFELSETFSDRRSFEAGPDEQEFLTDAEMKCLVSENVRDALKMAGGKIYGPNGAAALLEMKPTTLASYVAKNGLKGN